MAAATRPSPRRGRGLFISFEGGEGSGKSTQARLLHQHLTGLGWEAVLTREPGGTLVGEKVRRVLLHPESAGMDPLTELLLYAAARREHVSRLILPSIKEGATVIADRFSDATLAYQGYGRGLAPDLIRRLNLMASGGLMPDLTILVALDSPEKGLRRAQARDRAQGAAAVADRFEREAISFHRRVAEGYRRLARRHPGRISVVDGALPVADVHRNILELLRRRFPGMPWKS